MRALQEKERNRRKTFKPEKHQWYAVSTRKWERGMKEKKRAYSPI
jgi:hypothetical protein